MTAAHSRLAPSAAARWVRCPLSRAMAEAYPEMGDDEAAREGTAAHWVASEMLCGRTHLAGSIAPNGVEVTEEMLEGAELYCDDTLGTLGGEPLNVEQPVACPSIHPECWGTPDAWARPAPTMLYLWDYKFGHRRVDPFENWQLVAYASGILDRLGIDGYADQLTRVVFRVVQPRSYHREGPVREWSCMASDLRALVNLLHMAARREPTVAVVNPECDYCPGRHACDTLQRAAYAGAEFAAQGAAPVDLSPAAAALELRLLERAAEHLKARMTGLSEQVLGLIRQGQQVPGYRVEHGAGRERWAKPVPEVLALGAMLGVDLGKPPAAITPVQARKAGLPTEVVAAYCERPPGAAKLERDDGSLARRVFAGGM